jgi:hypothetical protein
LSGVFVRFSCAASAIHSKAVYFVPIPSGKQNWNISAIVNGVDVSNSTYTPGFQALVVRIYNDTHSSV